MFQHYSRELLNFLARQVGDHESLNRLAEENLPAMPRCQQPEKVYAFTRYARALIAVIQSLPPRCSEAFTLNRFDGLSHLAVAEHMAISRNMVALLGLRYHDARQATATNSYHVAGYTRADAPLTYRASKSIPAHLVPW